MDANNPLFEEFRAYWRLSEEMIASATKEEVAEAARILAMQTAHYARKYGELQLPDMATLLSATALDGDSVRLLRDGTEARVGVLTVVTGGELAEADSPMQ